MIDSTIMTRTVRLLYETAVIKNLSPRQVARYVGVSHMTIYRWYAGEVPSEANEDQIRAGVRRMDRLRDLPRGRMWELVDSGAALIAEVDGLADELNSRATASERARFLTDADLLSFQNICSLAAKYKVKLPRT
jgi:hypothetical protein